MKSTDQETNAGTFSLTLSVTLDGFTGDEMITTGQVQKIIGSLEERLEELLLQGWNYDLAIEFTGVRVKPAVMRSYYG